MKLRKAGKLMLLILSSVIMFTLIPTQNNIQAKGLTDSSIMSTNEWNLQNRLEDIGFLLESEHFPGGNITGEDVIELEQFNEMTIAEMKESQLKSLPYEDFTKKEIAMIAKMVHGEARGESLKGQIAVAAVILNRIQSEEFPDTVDKVLFQENAFTAVSDGQYFNTPDHTSYHAVLYAIKGMDPTQDALYYFNPDIATSEWIWTRKQTVQIGKHIFAK